MAPPLRAVRAPSRGPAERTAGAGSAGCARAALPAVQRGAVLLGFLVLLAASGWTVARWSQSAADERQREAEAELLWVGQQYRQAIESYYNATPGGVKRLPTKVEELLEDKRFPTPRRHLRQAYGDPILPGESIRLIVRAEQIVGVRSNAKGLPFRRTGFPNGLDKFADATSYAEWEFIANVRGIASLPGSAAEAASAAAAASAATSGFGSGFGNGTGNGGSSGVFSSPFTPKTPSAGSIVR